MRAEVCPMLLSLPLALALTLPSAFAGDDDQSTGATASAPAPTADQDASPPAPPTAEHDASPPAPPTAEHDASPPAPHGIQTVRATPPNEQDAARLYDLVTLDVQGLKEAVGSSADCSTLVLFIDGYPIQHNPPKSCDLSLGKVSFLLDRSPDNQANWNLIYGEPKSLTKTVHVTVGSSDTVRFGEGAAMKLTIMRPTLFALWAAVALVTVAGACLAARHTALVREPPRGKISAEEPDPQQGLDGRRKKKVVRHVIAPKEMPYSLSRTQQLFWLVLSALAYLFVYLVTWDTDSLSASVVGLLGISSATALGASLVDANKNRQLEKQHTELERSGLTDERTTQIKAEIRKFIQREVSKNFLFDIVSDGDTVSLQRAQVAVWTLVLGVIFVRSVYADLTMPDFDATLLGMMTVSSGTYLLGKGNENRVTPTPVLGASEKTNELSADAAPGSSSQG
jgi:hypothetical protein